MIAASFLTIIFKQMVWNIFNSRIGLERYYFYFSILFFAQNTQAVWCLSDGLKFILPYLFFLTTYQIHRQQCKQNRRQGARQNGGTPTTGW